MFPTFISILDIQSWWEVPSIAHFCSLFRSAFNLLDFDIEDLEEALLTDGTEETSWLQELIVRLLSGCLPNNEISTFNYQMFLRRLFRQKCQEHDIYNPFNTDIDFQLLPLRTKVDILQCLCDFRLDADDVLDQLKNLEADSLRVVPLGYDSNDSAYWYFYGTRLYREDFKTKNNKKKSVWQVICFTEDDWFQLTKKFKKSTSKAERQLHHTLSENFLPELPRLFKEKERLARKRLLENQPRRTSNRLRKENESEEDPYTKPKEEDQNKAKLQEEAERKNKQSLDIKRRKDAYERRSKLKEQSEDSQSEVSESRYEMAGAAKNKKSKTRPRNNSTCSNSSKDTVATKSSKRNKKSEKKEMPAKIIQKPTTVGRQTNNSLSAATGQIVIQSVSHPNKKKLKTSQVFRQTEEDLQTGMHKILDYVKNHDDAWPFADPVDEEYAPNYYSIIRKPMDLQTMEERLDSGFYKSYSKFKADFQLIVNNCRLYNGAENEYTGMVDNLVKVFETATERYLDQISSSDEEIAVEYIDTESDNKGNKKKKLDTESDMKKSKRKPMLAAQTDKKKERSLSEESLVSKRSSSIDSLHDEDDKPAKTKKVIEKPSKKVVKNNKAKKKNVGKKETESKKRSRSVSVSSLSHKSDSYESLDEIQDFSPVRTKKTEEKNKKSPKNKTTKKEKIEIKKTTKNAKEKHSKENKHNVKETKNAAKETKTAKENAKDAKKGSKNTKESVKETKNAKESAKETKNAKEKNAKKSKPDKKSKVEVVEKPKVGKSKKEKNKKIKKSPVIRRSLSRSLSRSPPRSDMSSPPPSWPPSSPESHVDSPPKKQTKRKLSRDVSDHEEALSSAKQKKENKLKELFDEEKPIKHIDKKLKKDHFQPISASPPLSPKPKDKHNKLRETIEKLKAKSEISNKIKTCEYDFPDDDLPKENKEKAKKEETPKPKVKDKPKQLKKDKNLDLDDGNSTMDSTISDRKSSSKKKPIPLPTPSPNNNVNNAIKSIEIEALTLATEQTLKDINKWLDDTPKFSNFSSASNSPSYTGLEEFDSLSSKAGDDPNKKKPLGLKKDASKDGKKRPFRDPTKLFSKRREVQRTIDRLQPGKSKGNLISNVTSVNKVDELFPLGPLSKIKDTKNSLIVKTDTNAPKLSLGSVLDSFGKHKFVDDQKKEEEKVEIKKVEVTPVLQDSNIIEDKEKKEVKEPVEAKEELVADDSAGGATPNLSAWFKAFGAPKMQPPVKKSELKPDGKENEEKPTQKVPVPDPSPSLDSPIQGGQPIPRQRRISTGSSMSERSSFSQDMDSPRVGIDERLAYPAPYPSPMHRSPSGASPVMASPRPDVSPKSAAYPPFNGQMRVGFYQDTVSTKSSPDKSCSPRDNPQSPYPQYSEHLYTPNTTQNATYSYTNSPFYTHTPNYSSTNPTPPYNTETSSSAYYDTNKSLTDQYQAKTVPNYSANSPASNMSSPASHPQHSPNVHTTNVLSPNVLSPNVHSPNVHSPNVHSPNIHSPNVHSPNVLSPNVHSPNIHSPNLHIANVQSPNVHSPIDSYQPDEPAKIPEKVLPTQTAIFPVKKRAYTDAEQKQLRYTAGQDEIINRNLQLGEQLSIGSINSPVNSQQQGQEKEVPKYIHQNIPEPKQLSLQSTCDTFSKSQMDNFNKQANIVAQAQQQNITQQQPPVQSQQQTDIRNYPNAGPANPYNYSNDSNYPLNIPSARNMSVSQQELERKIDLSKYTNMGYSGPEVNFSRSLQQQYNRPEYTRSTLPATSTQQTTETSQQASQANDMLRYANPNMLSQMSYKGLDSTATDAQPAHNSYSATPAHQSTRSNETVATRLTQSQEATSGYKSAEVTIPKPTYNAPSIGGNIANMSHLVDRFGNDERMLSGLQSSTTSYYSEKGLSTPHMFNKPISSNASALPMFSQANISMQSQYQSMQPSSTSMYNRQMNELQNPTMMSNEAKAQNLAQPATQPKKMKKPKFRKTATPTISADQPQSSGNQGFQSYAGLKGNTSIEPSAISLKTSSVVPGSAFNFGPTAAGLGISPALYGEKDTYPNYLDEFRSSNYYMAAAAAAHHRSTPESNDKQTRAHHTSSTPQSTSYPFLSGPQVRPSYPIGGPFIPPAQAQLMDTSSPIYQHYLQAGAVLNQGLLGPPGAYPPGYHAALSMRQPYDSMTRPSWL